MYSVSHDQVNDLKGEFADDMKNVLQAKIDDFGIEIMGVDITEVALPNDLQERLGKTTSLETKITEERKTPEYNKQQLSNEHAQDMKAVAQEFNLEERSILANLERYLIEMDEKVSYCRRIVFSISDDI